MSENTLIKVKNRSSGPAVYQIPELGIRREFTPGEIKHIEKNELIKLTYQYGGKKMLQHFLIIDDKDFAKEIGLVLEPEYWLQRVDIRDILQNASLDVFLDCLDFAPLGVLNLIKQEAVNLPVKDTDKIAAIKEKLKFDVSTAIMLKKMDEEDKAEPEKKERRVNVEPEKEEPQTRRTSTTYSEELQEEEVPEVVEEEKPQSKYQRV